jgi:hypothetical protein
MGILWLNWPYGLLHVSHGLLSGTPARLRLVGELKYLTAIIRGRVDRNVTLSWQKFEDAYFLK